MPGTAEAGATVTVPVEAAGFAGNAATAHATSLWALTVPGTVSLTGESKLTVTATDAAGNESQPVPVLLSARGSPTIAEYADDDVPCSYAAIRASLSRSRALDQQANLVFPFTEDRGEEGSIETVGLTITGEGLSPAGMATTEPNGLLGTRIVTRFTVTADRAAIIEVCGLSETAADFDAACVEGPRPARRTVTSTPAGRPIAWTSVLFGSKAFEGGPGKGSVTGAKTYGRDPSGLDIVGEAIVGANGDDVPTDRRGNETLFGRDGDDTLSGGANADRFHVSAGHDVITDDGVGEHRGLTAREDRGCPCRHRRRHADPCALRRRQQADNSLTLEGVPVPQFLSQYNTVGFWSLEPPPQFGGVPTVNNLVQAVAYLNFADFGVVQGGVESSVAVEENRVTLTARSDGVFGAHEVRSDAFGFDATQVDPFTGLPTRGTIHAICVVSTEINELIADYRNMNTPMADLRCMTDVAHGCGAHHVITDAAANDTGVIDVGVILDATAVPDVTKLDSAVRNEVEDFGVVVQVTGLAVSPEGAPQPQGRFNSPTQSRTHGQGGTPGAA